MLMQIIMMMMVGRMIGVEKDSGDEQEALPGSCTCNEIKKLKSELDLLNFCFCLLQSRSVS